MCGPENRNRHRKACRRASYARSTDRPKSMVGLRREPWFEYRRPNDEVERRGVSPASNEGNLSQSSIYSLAPNEDATRDRSNRLLDLITEASPPVVVAEANSVDVEAGTVIVLVIAQFWALPEPWQFLKTNNCAKRRWPRPIRANEKYLLILGFQAVQVIEQVDVCHGV
jgi:hypothetical protein